MLDNWAAHPGLIVIFSMMIGACIGSFLGVCIDRIPKNESIIWPPSHCVCGKKIPFYWNIPILSWLLLRGRARCCHAPIPSRYFWIEFLTAILFGLLVYNRHYPILPGWILISILLVVAYIDFDTMEIYDRFSIGGLLLGLLLSLIFPQMHNSRTLGLSFLNSFQGAIMASGILFWMGSLFGMVLHKESIGLGDVKLIGMIGSFIGLKGALFSIFGGCFIGLVIMMLLSIVTWIRHRSSAIHFGKEIPFAPFLVIGAIVYLLFSHYMNFESIFGPFAWY